MSVSVYSHTEHVLLNAYGGFFETFDNAENFVSFNFPIGDGYQTHQFLNSPNLTDNLWLTHIRKYKSSDWKNQEETENLHNKLANETRYLDLRENRSANLDNKVNPEKPQIWRPFSPSPIRQKDHELENSTTKRNVRINNRNIFYSIKPSNVKIGPSKTSVFRAVKKNTYACTQCPSRYMNNRQLNSHMRVHTGSKPFHCEHQNCYKSFARNEELTRHKRIHSGFKPHQCLTCQKRFGRKDHLSKHLKTHLQTSEKKVYQCSFPGCGHRYTRSDALTRHKTSAHANK